MDEFEAPPPQAGGDDPFGMGGGESYAPPPPLEGGGDMGMMGGGMAPSEPLPTFGEPERAPAMGGGMDMGGMDMGGMGGMGSAPVGGLGDEFNTEMGPVAQWRLEREEKLAARPWCQKAKKAESDAALKTKIEEAQGALATFYSELKTKSEKRAAENLAAQAQYVTERDAAIQADSWDSVCGMVNLKEVAGQTVDTSRMRSILVQLKHK